MAFDLETLGVGGGTGGLIAAIFQYFNREKITDLKKEIDDHKKNLEEHKKGAVMVANCVPCQARQSEIHKDIKADICEIKENMKADITEIKNDIKTLIGYALQRRNES